MTRVDRPGPYLRRHGTHASEHAHLRPAHEPLGDHRAPWVKAIAETRALLYVALREVIVGDNDAGVSMQLAAQPRPQADARA